MATLNTGLPTLLDQARARDPKGAIAQVVEVLTKKNTLLEDAVFFPCNDGSQHVVTSRTALPTVTWRLINQGVSASKSARGQVTESVGMAETQTIVDCELADKHGDAAAYRASEDMAQVAAFRNEMELGMFYHSTTTNPEKFMGLSARLSSTTGAWGSQIIKADATASGSDQTSIWLACWGPKTVYGLFPEDSKAGLTPHDMGIQMVDDGTGANKKFRAYQTVWNWKVGLCVEDWRYLVRIANVDTGNLTAANDTIIQAMVKAYHQLNDVNTGRPVFYVNRLVATYLHLQALSNTKQSTLSIERVGGLPVTFFLGIPVHTTDALTNTESTVS